MTAPPLMEVDDSVVLDLKQKLTSSDTSLPEKYRVLFSLRNVQGALAHEALELGAVATALCLALSTTYFPI